MPAKEYWKAIEQSGWFDQLSISSEDRHRSLLYQNEKKRRAFRSTVADLKEFLLSLQMQATIEGLTETNKNRVAQLILRTNQFNLTSRRHTAADIERMIRSGAILRALSLSDNFGDHGLVGVAIASKKNETAWEIDTFLLSCRVLGRGVENALMRNMLKSITEAGGEKVTGQFLSTKKNRQVCQFYSGLGFRAADGLENIWTWEAAKTPYPHADGITVQNN